MLAGCKQLFRKHMHIHCDGRTAQAKKLRSHAGDNEMKVQKPQHSGAISYVKQFMTVMAQIFNYKSSGWNPPANANPISDACKGTFYVS